MFHPCRYAPILSLLVWSHAVVSSFLSDWMGISGASSNKDAISNTRLSLCCTTLFDIAPQTHRWVLSAYLYECVGLWSNKRQLCWGRKAVQWLKYKKSKRDGKWRDTQLKATLPLIEATEIIYVRQRDSVIKIKRIFALICKVWMVGESEEGIEISDGLVTQCKARVVCRQFIINAQNNISN